MRSIPERRKRLPAGEIPHASFGRSPKLFAKGSALRVAFGAPPFRQASQDKCPRSRASSLRRFVRTSQDKPGQASPIARTSPSAFGGKPLPSGGVLQFSFSKFHFSFDLFHRLPHHTLVNLFHKKYITYNTDIQCFSLVKIYLLSLPRQ